MAGLEFFGLLGMARTARLRRDHHRDAVAIVIEGVRTSLVRLVALVAPDAHLSVPTGGPLLHGERSCSALVAGDASLAFFGGIRRKLHGVGRVLCGRSTRQGKKEDSEDCSRVVFAHSFSGFAAPPVKSRSPRFAEILWPQSAASTCQND